MERKSRFSEMQIRIAVAAASACAKAARDNIYVGDAQLFSKPVLNEALQTGIGKIYINFGFYIMNVGR